MSDRGLDDVSDVMAAAANGDPNGDLIDAMAAASLPLGRRDHEIVTHRKRKLQRGRILMASFKTGIETARDVTVVLLVLVHGGWRAFGGYWGLAVATFSVVALWRLWRAGLFMSQEEQDLRDGRHDDKVLAEVRQRKQARE